MPILPALALLLDDPPKTVKLPPAPLADAPTETMMEPDCPFDASPVAMLTLPVALDAAVLPVFKYKLPLLPAPLVAADCISTLPLAPVFEPPLTTRTLPPALELVTVPPER